MPRRRTYLVTKREVAASMKGLMRGEASIRLALEKSKRADDCRQGALFDAVEAEALRSASSEMNAAIRKLARAYSRKDFE